MDELGETRGDRGSDPGDEAPVPFGTFRPTERRALIGCAFGAMCMLLMPQELAGAGICLALAIGLYIWHLRCLKRERAAAAPPPAAPPPAADPT